MKDYIIFINLLAPLLGYILGSIKPFRVLNFKKAVTIVFVVCTLTVFSLITKISFSIDWIDQIIFEIGLIAIGYCGTGLKDAEGWNKKIIKAFRILTFVFYISLPLLFFGFYVMIFGNDLIGKTVHIDEYKSYRIKHVNIHSNFNFPGYHYVTVYDKEFLIEYPIKTINLGTYGQYGFNFYTVLADNTMIPEYTFDYDKVSDKLILLQYSKGIHTKSKTFKMP